ncbi:MAG: hypothetical protein AUH89_04290 [Ktedonobacter sp. 13_1_40CM_4_52_4]|nr:MAG: hypothetical protein AUH89_04290 [Ktedonobacter sp. 13_1_40CM_4_52_4]
MAAPAKHTEELGIWQLLQNIQRSWEFGRRSLPNSQLLLIIFAKSVAMRPQKNKHKRLMQQI